MIYVALLELVLLAVVTLAFLSVLRAQNRSHERREDILLDKALHAAGVPWTEAPASKGLTPDESQRMLEELLTPNGYTQTPEQEP